MAGPGGCTQPPPPRSCSDPVSCTGERQFHVFFTPAMFVHNSPHSGSAPGSPSRSIAGSIAFNVSLNSASVATCFNMSIFQPRHVNQKWLFASRWECNTITFCAKRQQRGLRKTRCQSGLSKLVKRADTETDNKRHVYVHVIKQTGEHCTPNMCIIIEQYLRCVTSKIKGCFTGALLSSTCRKGNNKMLFMK